MKKNGVKLHEVYAAKVSGEVVPVRLDKENPHGGWDGTNMRTKKQVRIKSAQRLRGLWPKKTMPVGEAKPAGEKPAVKATPKEKKPRLSLLNLAADVLAASGEPMDCKAIVEKVLAGGKWSTKGKTPAATLYSAIIREIAAKGPAARFRKTERGKFAATK